MSNNNSCETRADGSICSRCSLSGRTCCQWTEIFLTKGDVERIAAAGHNDFSEYKEIPKGIDLSTDPVWALAFDENGSRRILLRDENGDCSFLRQDGCSLSMEARPLLCRLYPFEYDAEGIKGVTANMCPEPENGNAPLLLALLAMNRDEAEVWRAMFYQEIREEFS